MKGCIFSSQCAPHLSLHGEGSSWSFNQPDGKERHRSQIHLSCHSLLYAPLVSRHFPFLAFKIFFAFVSSTPYSTLSLHLYRLLSRSLTPTVPVGLKWLKVTLIWLDFSTEGVREAEKTRQQKSSSAQSTLSPP